MSEVVNTSVDIPESDLFLEQEGWYNTSISSNFISASLLTTFSTTPFSLVTVPAATSSVGATEVVSLPTANMPACSLRQALT